MAKYKVISACFDPRSNKKELLTPGEELELDAGKAEKLVKFGRLTEVESAKDDIDKKKAEDAAAKKAASDAKKAKAAAKKEAEDAAKKTAEEAAKANQETGEAGEGEGSQDEV